ncbi:hypothetical protein PtA15_7A232 [Puccinia triticina]|uniref:Uncharacterized protein n=1 Tax=Puccinia triticina TaxID=208348 RepID=A0ABY7CMQ1_9BASI|nr:uncharacterized protein PtA15_7A232 [Puccinia triticina]WAQ86506.1 hypothetical protein PtA15_7A232 [Puccinia triticina]
MSALAGEKERRFSFSSTSSSTLIGMRTKRKKTTTVGHESHWQKDHKYPAAEQQGLVLGPCPSNNGARRPPGEFCVFEYLSQTAAVNLHPTCADRTMHVRGPLLVNNLKAAGVNKPAPRLSP